MRLRLALPILLAAFLLITNSPGVRSAGTVSDPEIPPPLAIKVKSPLLKSFAILLTSAPSPLAAVDLCLLTSPLITELKSSSGSNRLTIFSFCAAVMGPGRSKSARIPVFFPVDAPTFAPLIAPTTASSR